MAYNESQQPRFAQAVARLHDVKGNPAPQITPEIGHGVTLDQVSFGYELEVLTGRRNCFAGITAPAIAATSAGIVLSPALNTIGVFTSVQVQKAVAGFISIQFTDQPGGFSGTFSTSFVFFRDSRLGNSQTARPGTAAFTHLTGGLPVGTVIKRVFLPANTWTRVDILPGLVLAQPTVSVSRQFGVFNETLNEAMDVMVDFYERAVSASELVLPQ